MKNPMSQRNVRSGNTRWRKSINIKNTSIIMSGSECEENNSRHHHHRRHRKRELSPESYREYKKRHKSHKRRKSKERSEDHKRHKIKEESKEHVKVKSEVKDRHEKISIKLEPREDDSGSRDGRSRDSRLGPSGSKRESRGDRWERRGDGNADWGRNTNKGEPKKEKGEPQKPDFGLSGKLAEDTNIFNGVVIKYSEPPEARMPKKRWRLYPFKGDQGLPTLYIHRQSAYLLGRDRKVADIPIDHPSCSKQHAALQYRLVSYKRVDGSAGKQIRLYLIDLESANGTYINNNKIEPKKYVELFEKDVIKFGFSSREYVLLHEHSKDDDESENES